MIRICDPTWHPFLYERFRRKARLLMSLERAGHTLQPTALVHEGIIRIFRQRKPPRTPDEWLAAMAVMMRRATSPYG